IIISIHIVYKMHVFVERLNCLLGEESSSTIFSNRPVYVTAYQRAVCKHSGR
ncbi:hypothetical protein L9F63_012896, partial [Diploptera punctata]